MSVSTCYPLLKEGDSFEQIERRFKLKLHHNPHPKLPMSHSTIGELNLTNRILQSLHNKNSQTAIELSKAVGRTTASEVNPTLYALQKDGHVVMTSRRGNKPVWSLPLIQSGFNLVPGSTSTTILKQ